MSLGAHKMSGEETTTSITTTPAAATASVAANYAPTTDEQNIAISTPGVVVPRQSSGAIHQDGVVEEFTPIQGDGLESGNEAALESKRMEESSATVAQQSSAGSDLVLVAQQQSSKRTDRVETMHASLLEQDSSQIEEDMFDERDPHAVDKVLVVDDALLNRKMLIRLLAGNGFESDVAEDGRIAVDLVGRSIAENRPYKAILMDSQMPNMDGPTATRIIRELGYDGPIIGVTGNALRADIELFMSSGVNTVLIKPVVDFDTVLAAMETPLQR